MPILKKIYNYKEIVAIITTSFLSLILFFNAQSPRVSAVKADIADIVTFISTPKTWYQDLLTVRKENQILKESLVQMQLLNARLFHHKNENIALKGMLQFSEQSPLSLKPCAVVDLELTSSIQSIIVDVGSNDFILKELGVLDMKCLIGKIISVGNNASFVQLISDKNYRVSIRVGEERTLGIFLPTHGKFGILEGIQESIHIEPGDIAYTSGISDIYPMDIPVARVLTTLNNSESGFQEVSVEIIADIYNLNYVFIIQ